MWGLRKETACESAGIDEDKAQDRPKSLLEDMLTRVPSVSKSIQTTTTNPKPLEVIATEDGLEAEFVGLEVNCFRKKGSQRERERQSVSHLCDSTGGKKSSSIQTYFGWGGTSYVRKRHLEKKIVIDGPSHYASLQC